ncbi:thioredoxin-like protein [Mycena sp. CBHHK59/15]|nr:thioredoxin-like protein [Mycena sp. CBHHK59/15]
MVLKFFGSPFSTCTQRVAAVLIEKKVPFEFVPIDMTKGAHKSAEHIAKQPFGQIPDDDGYILYESRTICRYTVEDKYPDQETKLVPSDIQ